MARELGWEPVHRAHRRRILVAGCAVVVMLTAAAVSSGCAPASGSGSAEPPPGSRSTAASVAPSKVPPARSPTADDLIGLGSDFTSTPTRWTWLDDVEGGPDFAGQPGMVHTADGLLTLRPPTSTWFQDFRGPFLFQRVTGDVVLVVRLKVSGRHTPVPIRSYSLAGVMARAPQRPSELSAFGAANWAFVTTGTGVGDGVPQIELKNTKAGQSEVVLTPSAPGWVELALARVGPQLVSMYRLPHGSWTEGRRWARPDLPATLQWGLVAYTDWQSFQTDNPSTAQVNKGGLPHGSPDLIATVDRARFLRPHIPDGVDITRLDSPPLLRLLAPDQQ